MAKAQNRKKRKLTRRERRLRSKDNQIKINPEIEKKLASLRLKYRNILLPNYIRLLVCLVLVETFCIKSKSVTGIACAILGGFFYSLLIAVHHRERIKKNEPTIIEFENAIFTMNRCKKVGTLLAAIFISSSFLYSK